MTVKTTTDSAMKYEKVKNLIDRNLGDKLREIPLLDLKDDLKERVERFKGIALRDFGIDAEEILKSNNVDDMESSRLRYNLYYIIHCRTRLKDIDWIIRNRLKFHKWSNNQIFKLIMLKEKLHVSNAKPCEDPLASDKSIFKWDIGDELQDYSGGWIKIIGYAIVNDEPRYVVLNEQSGWLTLDEVRQTSPRLIKGSLSSKGNSFRLIDAVGRKVSNLPMLISTDPADQDRLKVLLDSVSISNK